MEALFGFLKQDADEIEPILCGYFNKVVQGLLNKQVKPQVLEFLLLSKKGEIYNDLVSHLNHHSLA